MRIFREVVEPILDKLHALLEPGWYSHFMSVMLLTWISGIVRDAVWRNDFCRYVNASGAAPHISNTVLDT